MCSVYFPFQVRFPFFDKICNRMWPILMKIGILVDFLHKNSNPASVPRYRNLGPSYGGRHFGGRGKWPHFWRAITQVLIELETWNKNYMVGSKMAYKCIYVHFAYRVSQKKVITILNFWDPFTPTLQPFSAK